MSGVEVAVIHEIAGRIDRAGADLEALPLFIFFAPHHRVARSLSDADDRARPVTVESAAAADGKFLNVAAVGRPGDAEAHDAHALSLHRIVVERKRVDVGHQVGLPAAHREPLVMAKKVRVVVEPVAKLKRIAEDELFVVKEIEQMRQVGPRQKTHRLVLGDVEVLVGDVERDREDRPRAPFESPLAALLVPHRRRAAAGHDVNESFVEVALRQGLARGRDLADVGVVLLLIAHVEIATERPHPLPRLELQLF